MNLRAKTRPRLKVRLRDDHLHDHSDYTAPAPDPSCAVPVDSSDLFSLDDDNPLTISLPKSRTFQCIVCQRTFQTLAAVRMHERTHLSEDSRRRIFSCLVCPFDASSSDELSSHTVQHVNSAGLFACPRDGCSVICTTFKRLRAHVRYVHARASLTCPICPMTFKRSDKLARHALTHDKSARDAFLCTACGRTFARKDKLGEHTKRMHQSEKPSRNAKIDKSMPALLPRPFASLDSSVDSDAAALFSGENSRVKHIFQCEYCPLTFKRRGMFSNHVRRVHTNLPMPPMLCVPLVRAVRRFECPYCERTYATAAKWRGHVKGVHPETKEAEEERRVEGKEEAGKADGTERKRRRREPVANAVMAISGADGSTITWLTNDFSRVVATHTYTPFGCAVCGKEYSSRSMLVKHLTQAHEGFRPPPRQFVPILPKPPQQYVPVASVETMVPASVNSEMSGEFDQPVDVRVFFRDTPTHETASSPQYSTVNISMDEMRSLLDEYATRGVVIC